SQADNRRGGGFDKPPFKKDDPSPTCASASSESFGHSGFTGTYLWVDPARDLVYVFLSNRVYPDSHNKKLNALGIRTAILELLCEE
ncbi:MAG: serine hydrolase, partial [Bacteroidales bacterium]|nr:serine hydrolase [Bacteroidales bacterium]